MPRRFYTCWTLQAGKRNTPPLLTETIVGRAYANSLGAVRPHPQVNVEPGASWLL